MGKERKLQIIKAAVKRFDKHGLNKTTLDEIARDLRIGKATIYNYFESKEDLYFSALEWEGSLFLEEIKVTFSKSDLTLKECLIEYFSLKELIPQRYKLISDTIIHIISDSSFETENNFIKSILLKEEELIKEAISKSSLPKSVSLSQLNPSYLVTLSWGLFWGNKILLYANPEKESNTKEIALQFLKDIQ